MIRSSSLVSRLVGGRTANPPSELFVVTGAGGYVGGALARRLARRGTVLGLAREGTAAPAARLISLAADLTAAVADRPDFRGAAVVHSAALMNSPSREDLWKVNVEGTWRMLEWAARHEASHFVLVSTGGVYGYTDGVFSDEDDPVRPIGFYGHTKWIAEQAVRAYHETTGIPVTVVRLFFPYGPQQTRGILTFIDNAVRQGTPLTINRGGAPRMNPVHIDDVVSALEAILEAPSGHSVFNLCGDESVSFLDLVRRFEAKHGRKAVLTHSDRPHGDLLGSNRRLRERLGWSCRSRVEV